MNLLDVNDFVTKEVLPEINDLVRDYLESEYSYIENEDDLADLEEAEINEELVTDIEADLLKLAESVKDEYNFDEVDFEYPEDILSLMIESSLEDHKEIMLQKFHEEFEKEEYFDEYYSGEYEY